MPVLHRYPWIARSSRSTAVWTKRFWLSLLERALKTFAQSLIALWPLGENAFGLLDVDWQSSLSVAGLAAAVSALTSIASAGIGPDGSPSLVGEPPVQPATVLNADPDDAPGDTAEFTLRDVADARSSVVHTGDNSVDGHDHELPGRHERRDQ
jgi:hypothetical protein